MDTTAFIVTNVAWLLLAGLAAFRTLRYEQRRQKLIVAVVEAIPPGGRVEEQRPDGTRLIVTTMAPLTGGSPAKACPAATRCQVSDVIPRSPCPERALQGSNWADRGRHHEQE
jgi:hypothetical protein